MYTYILQHSVSGEINFVSLYAKLTTYIDQSHNRSYTCIVCLLGLTLTIVTSMTEIITAKIKLFLFILGFLKNECHIEERNCIALS